MRILLNDALLKRNAAVPLRSGLFFYLKKKFCSFFLLWNMKSKCLKTKCLIMVLIPLISWWLIQGVILPSPNDSLGLALADSLDPELTNKRVHEMNEWINEWSRWAFVLIMMVLVAPQLTTRLEQDCFFCSGRLSAGMAVWRCPRHNKASVILYGTCRCYV